MLTDELLQEGIIDAKVTISKSEVEEYSDREGRFIITGLKPGEYVINIEADQHSTITQIVQLGEEDLDLGVIKMAQSLNVPLEEQYSVISLNDSDIDDNAGQDQVSSLLTAGRDVIGNAAAFNLSAGRYRLRGLNSEYTQTLLNGVRVNDLDDGRVYWSAWGGLNDVFRARESQLNLNQADYTHGDLGGATNIDLRASSQWKQTRLSYATSNRSYTNRVMFVHSSGMQSNGWAYSISGSRRWGQSGFIEGTFYDAYSYFASVEKRINDKHSLNLVVMGSPLKRGRTSPAIQEVYDLAGSNFYSSAWGLQQGEVRNSRELDSHLPIAILNHDWNISKNTSLKSAVFFQTGKYGISRLDWQDAPDPRPDYYRKLPSFQESPEVAAQLTAFYENDPNTLQIDWDRFYEVNRARMSTIEDVDGIEGNTVTGLRSAYVVQDQRFDNTKLTLNTTLDHQLNDKFNLQAGFVHQREKTENYTILKDLLGGEFYLNIDQFAIRDFPGNDLVAENDLDNPNRIVREGDRYFFDYDVNINQSSLWGQLSATGSKLDYFLSTQVSNTSFYRFGNVRNGKFPDSSGGKSETTSFQNFAVKGGATYKLNGRNYLYANAAYQTRAPYARFAFVSPRTRDEIVSGLESEKNLATEIGYIARYPRLKARAAAYYIKIEDQLYNRSFYQDEERTFVNYIMSGVDKLHIGGEVGFEAKATNRLTFTGVANIGQFTFDSRPNATIAQDNNANALIQDRTVYIQNYYLSGTPQRAFTAGVGYEGPGYWRLFLNANYFSNSYLDINPDRRTEAAVDGVVRDEELELWNEIINQEELEGNWTVDLFLTKSFKYRDYFLYLNVGVNNILNNTDFRTGGFEQLRFDYEDKDVGQFPNRYFYSFGTNYFVSATLKI